MTDKERRKRLVKKLDRLLTQLRQITVATYYRAIEELRDRIAAGEAFSWKENGTEEKRIMNLLKILEGKINYLIASGVSEFYAEGMANAADQINKALENDKFKFKKERLDALRISATEERRKEAVAGHAETVSYRGGAMNNLSNRVWDFKEQSKEQIERIVQDAIAKGQGVNAAKNSVKEFLNTDDAGNMKHHGAGVYNSPEKNCARLLRTEVNAAYRSAEIDGYQKSDMVLGYKIFLSGNHYTKRGNKPPKKLHDICDELQGDYPKSFYWTGWHPNCRCIIVPITLTPEQFGAYMDAEDEGREKEYIDSISVKDFPENFKRYYAAHASNFAATVDKNPKKRHLPSWIENNQKMLPEIPTVKPGEKKQLLASNAAQSKAIVNAKIKFDSYPDSQYEKTYFDEKNNGYLVTDKQRIATATQNEDELRKYIKEHNMCVTFANAGHTIEHLSEISGVSSSDVRFDGIPAELKKTENENHIIDYAIKATTKQGAQIVLFQVDVMNARVRGKFRYLSNHGIHGYYFITGDENNIIQY